MSRNALAGMLLLAALGCAPTDLPPVSDGAAFRIEQDEKRIWLQAWKETNEIDQSGMLYDDAALTGYLNGLVSRLQPESVLRNIPFAIRVISDPHLNAFTFPNGVIYVHSGLLAVMESEAQFAALIGHEMVHATHRHAVRSFRHEENEMAVAAAIRTVLGGHRGELSALASISGYSQELESEADAQGLALVVRAGYDPRDAVRLFEHLREEVRAGGITEPFFYGTHPRIQERIENLSALLAGPYSGTTGGIIEEERFFRSIAGLILDNAELDIRAGRFPRALRSLERYRDREPDGGPRPAYLLGELYRKRGFPGDRARAGERYGEALGADRSYAAAWRGSGLVSARAGDREAAVESFRRYLELDPQATERGYIERYLAGGTP